MVNLNSTGISPQSVTMIKIVAIGWIMLTLSFCGVWNGCQWRLWTQSWQAGGFYQQLGYSEFTRFDDFPKGHSRIGFRKILA